MGAPILYDYFCGEGGAAEGYRRAGWRILGIDNDPARLARYPFDHVKADALEHLAEHGHEAHAIHASPTCTGYSRGTVALPDRLDRYDRLIPATRDLLEATGRPYVIENVEGADECLHPRNMQCAGAYGGARRDKVEARTIRHGGYVPAPEVMSDLLGIDWMSEKGLFLSIPPAYTEHLGTQLLEWLEVAA